MHAKAPLWPGYGDHFSAHSCFLSVILIVMFFCGLVWFFGIMSAVCQKFSLPRQVTSGQKRMYDIQKPKTTTIGIHSWVRWYSSSDRSVWRLRLLLPLLSYFWYRFHSEDYNKNTWWHGMQMHAIAIVNCVPVFFIFTHLSISI